MIQATELMIGDWVMFEDDESDYKHPFQVESIDELGNIGIGDLSEGEDICPVALECFTPIPLTKEILEKNGFKKFPFLHIEEQHQWTWWKSTLLSVTLWFRELNDDAKDGMMLKIESPISTLCVKVNYVHEFQHALRLCGIDKTIELTTNYTN